MKNYLIALVLFSVFTIIYGQNQSCNSIVENLCSVSRVDRDQVNIDDCNSITTSSRSWTRSKFTLNKLAKTTLQRSYELLGLAINHGSFSRNLIGFEKLFRYLSNISFENVIKIIKYITRRGGIVTFDGMGGKPLIRNQFIINEFQSMSAAQSIEKELLQRAQNFDYNFLDSNLLQFIEEELIKPKTEILRKLTGYVHDMDKLMRSSGNSFNIFMFEKYLQK